MFIVYIITLNFENKTLKNWSKNACRYEVIKMNEKISCSRCGKEDVGRPLNEIYTDLGDGYFSYLKYICHDCGCVFLIEDHYMSPGEWAVRSFVIAKLAEGKTLATVAKKLHMSSEKVASLVDRPVDMRGLNFSCPPDSRYRHPATSPTIAYKPRRKRIA
jgi:hypothetical protein